MSRFKINDRVTVYGPAVSGKAHIGRGERGTVVIVDPFGISVQLDIYALTTDSSLFHPKQLRKLKPKKKPLRIEGEYKWGRESVHSCPVNVPYGTLDTVATNADFDQFIGKRTKITVEVIE